MVVDLLKKVVMLTKGLNCLLAFREVEVEGDGFVA